MNNQQLVEETISVFTKPFRPLAVAGMIRAKGHAITDEQAATIIRAMAKRGQVRKYRLAGWYEKV